LPASGVCTRVNSKPKALEMCCSNAPRLFQNSRNS
jgi:hypothetical protein